jgi:hypothetical protein
MSDRRRFLKQAAAAGILSTIPVSLFSRPQVALLRSQEARAEKIWACLIHISMNMWKEKSQVLPFDDSLWNDVLGKMVEAGMNMVVMDLGDAIVYKSHPEIAVQHAWSTDRLYKELEKIRAMGLEPIPKLNFSTCHDAWLGKYSRMISTDYYYAVCRDIIAEVAEIYGRPRLFHLGMDEENARNQREHAQMVVRQHDLYWGDIYFLIGEVMKNGSRPWVWQDYVRHEPENFARMMPKSVLQSNWYNRLDFNPETNLEVKGYQTLESLGYDQVPGGSNYYDGTDENFLGNVRFCADNIADERLLGFIQSPWVSTEEVNREKLLRGIELAGEAKAWYEKTYK